ncbi:hypothetical protein [Nostoc sp.]|uniref:hypothetical protein n=1 Tax=Nostoc sp. TaxID=1180 RepID=UPI002FF56E7A
MKNFTKTILLTVVVSILEFSSYTQVTYANQFPYRPLTASQSSSGVQVAEVDSPHDRDSTHEDGDREASDVRRVAVAKTIEKATLGIKKTIIKNLLMQGGITLGSSGLFSIPAIIAIPSKTVLGVVVLKLKNLGSAFSAAMQLA